MMKKCKIFFVIMAMSIIYSMFGHEVLAASTVENKQGEMAIEDEYLIRFIEAIKDRDTDSMRELWVGKGDGLSQESFDKLFDYWDGKEITSYKKIGEKKRSADEKQKQPSGMEYEYDITSGSETIRLKFSITDEYKDGRYIDSYQFLNNVQSTEVIDLHKKLKLAQWGMKILMVAEIAFSLTMFILCIKERPRLWVLWEAAILLIYGGIAIGFAQKFTIGIFAYLLYFPKIFFSSTGIMLELSLPLGAITYYCTRKKLNKTSHIIDHDKPV